MPPTSYGMCSSKGEFRILFPPPPPARATHGPSWRRLSVGEGGGRMTLISERARVDSRPSLLEQHQRRGRNSTAKTQKKRGRKGMENNGQQQLLLRDKKIFKISAAILFFLFRGNRVPSFFLLGERRQFYVRGIMKESVAGKKIGGSYPPRQRAIPPPKFQFSRSSKSSSAVRML